MEVVEQVPTTMQEVEWVSVVVWMMEVQT